MKNLFDNRILIVDDTPENLDILVELLENFDKKIAMNGEEALEIALEENLPDLILLDILMPGMDGYEVCRRLRANERTRNVPIIFLTVKNLKEDVVKGFEVGGQDYITKPFDGRELMERVKTQLELKSQRETLKYQGEVLKNMNVVLEKKVEERTAQLQDALSKLEEASKELQVLDTAKNNFLHMISHEIRTPLNGIVGVSYILKDFIEDNAQFTKFVNILQSNVDRLEDFSKTALLVTQLQADYIKASPEPLKTQELISRCVGSLKDYSIKHDAVITIDSMNPLLEINADKELIEIALKSVLHNAIKYTGKDAKVKVNVHTYDKKTIIEVIDNGIGFTDEILNSIYKPFGSGSDHIDQGIGLSLYSVKMIMKLHNGDIFIENLPSAGAMVKFVFNN